MLVQNLAARGGGLHAEGDKMCPPDKPVFKFGKCFSKTQQCKPGYTWVSSGVCRKEFPCPSGRRVGNKCHKKTGFPTDKNSCFKKTYRDGKKYCKSCNVGYRKCSNSRALVVQKNLWLAKICCKCPNGILLDAEDDKKRACYLPFINIPVDEQRPLETGGELKRNCSELAINICGKGAAFGHCVVRGEENDRRCAWNTAGYPYCEIRGNTATCDNIE
ncbi:MAG: hypothetical protein AAF471_02355 [Myxococcota bacterium]